MNKNFLKTLAVAGVALGASAAMAIAGPLMDRIKEGKPIRIGFANEVPWAYPGDNNKPLGFVNAYALGVLHKMGYKNIQPVVTDWGGLIPALKANRLDIVTGGLYILKSRCENIAFSEPMAKVSDAFIVAKGNPMGIENYTTIKDKGATLVTGAGYNTVEAAKKVGIPDSKVMTVPGPTEILAAVRAGRADAGGGTYFTMQALAKQSDGAVSVTDPSKMPEWTQNWVGIGFRKADQDFVDAFNKAQVDYLGSPEMLKAVAPFGYTKSVLPDDHKTSWVCENR